MAVMSIFVAAVGLYLVWTWYQAAHRLKHPSWAFHPGYGLGMNLLFGLAMFTFSAGWLVVQYGTTFTNLGIQRPGWLRRRSILWSEVRIVRLRVSRGGDVIDLVSDDEWFPLDCAIFVDREELRSVVEQRCNAARVVGFELW